MDKQETTEKPKKESTNISAQVILCSASGKKPTSETIITAENIAEYMPATETVKLATKTLSDLGFKVGPVVGISCSISAVPETFEKVFKTQVEYREKECTIFVDKDGKIRKELPKKCLPKELTELVTTITFTSPPDFGPSEFDSCEDMQ